ncbi:hypothetical protein ACHAWU_005232 [Discostella pseudostelligera]|uniref:Uncharacterized protein n=1 Tax=Discostella pseudostelligera TaxID=259834 RepID=A0ABD3M9K0_9STRA
MSLQMHFGMSMTNLSLYLRFGRRIVASILNRDHFAKIALPLDERIQEYKEAIAEKYPLLGDVWSAMDGLKTPIQQSGSTKTQGYFYNLQWLEAQPLCDFSVLLLSQWHHPNCTHESSWGDP